MANTSGCSGCSASARPRGRGGCPGFPIGPLLRLPALALALGAADGASHAWARPAGAGLAIRAIQQTEGEAAYGEPEQEPPAAPRDGTDASVAAIEIEIHGIEDEEVSSSVLARLELEEKDEADVELAEARVRRLFRSAEEEIRAALEPFGYYHPEIRGELVRAGDTWRASWRIDLGEPVRIARADVQIVGAGADDDVLREQIASFPLSEGDPLRHALYEGAKQALLTLALERGYLRAEYTRHRVPVDLTTNRAGIELTLETGPRYRLGEVRFEQSAAEPLEEELLARFVPFDPGEPYTTDALTDLQRNLTDSRYFQTVRVESRLEEADSLRVPIRVTLVPRPAATYDFGLGYGTDTGPRGSVGVQIRRLNANGHRVQGEIQGSLIGRKASVRYLVPVGDRVGDEVTITGGYRFEEFESNETETFLAGAALAQSIGTWRQALSFELRQESFEAGSDAGTSTLLLPGASWSRTRANDLIYTTRGSRLLFQMRGTTEAIGSTVSFIQGKVEGKLIRSPHERGRLIVRVEAGYVEVNAFSRLPTSMRFFAGGDRSVRGYSYHELGPRDAAGVPTGGTYLLTGTLEYEYRFLEKWGVAAFVDAGSVALDLDRFAPAEGVGIGARWVSPIGLVRLDLASAVSRPGDPLRLHLVIGPDL